MNKILSSLSPVFEPERYGHTYVDITATQRLFGGAIDAAWRAQKELKNRLQLEVSVGLASNKMVSKLAAVASKPRGLRPVAHGEEAKFIAPFHVGLLPAVTKPIQEQLLDLNIRLVRDLQPLSLAQLAVSFGPQAVALYQNARGVDPRPVQPPDHAPQVCVSRTLPEDSNDLELLRAVVFALLEKAAGAFRYGDRAVSSCAGALGENLHAPHPGARSIACALPAHIPSAPVTAFCRSCGGQTSRTDAGSRPHPQSFW
jgi:DNA polymerase-4